MDFNIGDRVIVINHAWDVINNKIGTIINNDVYWDYNVVQFDEEIPVLEKKLYTLKDNSSVGYYVNEHIDNMNYYFVTSDRLELYVLIEQDQYEDWDV